ncbi:MAG: LemA family protein [Lachnospiraceae bacterium]|nr:LemA family protein [Lachnospiraceae bacterium]
MWIGIVIVIIVVLVVLIIAMYNSFVKLDNKVNEAFSTMDVYLVKRWNMIPKLVEVVKAYASHEKSTLESIVSLRNGSYESMTEDDKIKANVELSKGINKMMAVAEGYPELKSSENFIDLSNKLFKVEDEIANSRKYYNGVVRLFNNKTETFPGNIFAKLFGYSSKQMFEAEGFERNDVGIDI